MKRTALLVCLVTIIYAFREQDNPPFELKMAKKFYTIFQRLPREKIYLHTDKDIYYAGENIWFRAFLVNAMNNRPEALSRIFYVEFTDKKDSVLQRVKFTEWDSTLFGNLKVPEKMVQGEYCIRAFTYWMQNEGPDYFFKKNIRVLNPSEARVNTDVKYIRDEDGSLRAEITLSNAQDSPYTKEQFLIKICDSDGKEKTESRNTDDKGILRVELAPGDYSIHLSTKDKSSIDLDRTLYIPKEASDFDVQFFPEGGNLLSNNYQCIAFKAIDSNGLSTEIEGMVYADSIPVANIKSEHKGMGNFNLAIYEGKKYHAEVTNSKGITKRFTLPAASNNGLGIQLNVQDSIIHYKIMQGKDANLPENLVLLLQHGGQLINTVPVDEQHLGGIILPYTLPEGIIHAVLLDDSYHIYSQRLFFARSEKPVNVEIDSEKKKYFRREKVNVGLSLDSSENKAFLSMAVVPDSDRDTNSYKDNIRSYLLMTSDLKGYIEEPAYYFSDTTQTIGRHLDLLMQTHGWTKFNITDIAKDKPDSLEFYLERGQSIAGKVENFWNKAVKNATLLFISDQGDINMTMTDSTGRFCNNLFFLDKTRFVVRATGLKKKNRVLILFDKEKFLPVKNFFPYNEEVCKEEEEFYKNAYQNYYYENGEKIYLLNEVKVIRKIPPKKYNTYDNWVDDRYRLDSTMIANDPEEDIIKLIVRKFPGLMAYNDEIYRIGPYPPSPRIGIVLNGFTEERSTFVKMIPKRYILGISFLIGPVARNFTSFYGSDKCKDSVILITTNPDYHFEKPSSHVNIKRIAPQGIQLPDKFYVPKYEIDSVRNNPEKDERNTIYWEPVIRIEPGEIKELSFYTGDKLGNYTIIIEGITQDGKIIRKIKKLRIE